ncbi:MAG: NUDIX domain-containing protein [Hyphomicrobiales bacterium]|nr:NUDIX domain-containing protein [Hyphomicrobiales bacterium]
MAAKWIAARVLFPYWRLTRGMTFGAQGVLVDGENRVLLIRHGYRPGWHFPGGGVDWGETAEEAMRREVMEEAGAVVGAAPALHGLFANFQTAPCDHIAVFVVRDWRQDAAPPPNREIAEQGWFPALAPPPDTSPGTLRRLGEIFRGAALSAHW